jgi:hypothetical protein
MGCIYTYGTFSLYKLWLIGERLDHVNEQTKIDKDVIKLKPGSILLVTLMDISVPIYVLTIINSTMWLNQYCPW